MQKLMSEYREKMVALVEASGGIVTENLFVEKPGVMVLSTQDAVSEGAKIVFNKMHIWSGQSPEDQLAEFIARITYFSFPNDAHDSESASKHLHTLLRNSGHTSPYEVAKLRPNVLVAGIAIETMLEIIANKYAIGRICSSRTDAMKNPLFRIPNAPPSLQEKIRSFIRETEKIHTVFNNALHRENFGALTAKDQKEIINMGHSGYKAGYMVIAADVDFWNQKLERRLADKIDGVELELRGVLKQILYELLKVCPAIHHVRTISEISA